MDILFTKLEKESYNFKCPLNGTEIFKSLQTYEWMLIALWLHIKISLLTVEMTA